MHVSWTLRLAAGVFALAMSANATSVRAQATIFSEGAGAGARAGQVFLTLGGMVGVRKLPPWVSPIEVFGAGGQLFTGRIFKPELILLGPGVTTGYVFSPGVFPDWMSRRVRVSLTGSAWWGSWSSHRRFDLAGTSFTIIGIRGKTGFADNFPTAGFYHRLHVEHREAETILRIATDWRLSLSVTLSPSIGAFGGVSRTRYKYNAHVIEPGNIAGRAYRLYQLINGHMIGGLFGLRLNWRINSRLTLHTASHFGAYYAQANLFATDCFNGAPGSTICQLPGSFSSTVRSNRSQAGFRTGITTFLTIRLRRSFIQIGGFVPYLSAMPSVLNQVETDPGVGFPTGTPLRLVFRHAWTTGGMVMWRLPFGPRP